MVLSACAAVSAFPELFELSREGLIRGEVWRLWTGHLVHANATHFALDVGALVILAAVADLPRRVWRFTLWAAPAAGLGSLALHPELVCIVGLSGLLHGLVILRVLELAHHAPRIERRLLLLIAALVIGKAVTETTTGQALVTSNIDLGLPTAYGAHICGTAAGIVASSISASRLTARLHGRAMVHCESSRSPLRRRRVRLQPRGRRAQTARV